MKSIRTAVLASSLLLLAACAQTQPSPATPAATPAAKVSMKETVGESGAPAEANPAKALYAAQCAGCHGKEGEKGLKGKTAYFVTTALQGYKAGTYGGAKKQIMQARAAKLSDGDIEALAGFVAGL